MWGWPLIGETLEFIASAYTSKPVTFMDKRKSLYGDVFRTHILGKAIIVSTDPDVNKTILQNHGNAFIPSYPKSITELLGKSSILQINGPLHKRMHALIGVFLKSPQFKARITREIENVVRLSLSTWTDKNCQVYVQDETKKITFEILVRVLLSIGPGEEMELLKKEFEEFIKGLICLPINLPGTRLYKSLKAKKRLLKIVDKIVEDRKMAMEKMEEKTSPNDAIDVISETLRLANIINGVWRKALKDVKIKGYLIPKGWSVLASFSSVHMDETNYENPYEFDPWRWKKIGNALSSNIFTPFGGGQRLCPGLELSRLEISIFLHHFVTTYRTSLQVFHFSIFALPSFLTVSGEHRAGASPSFDDRVTDDIKNCSLLILWGEDAFYVGELHLYMRALGSTGPALGENEEEASHHHHAPTAMNCS
ncbi:hypothetical protein DH2020_040547 [Rehmannia glutinosa]|uniref:3-epi-6-deoxocathasterone 23-monooxygenase n=1 Tax=Rehmannia glutinosa TaxID=99300 RepID=A0ABR0UTV5_REHGL